MATIAKRDIPAGEVRPVEVDGVVVAVCNVEGTFYALEGTCPHAGGPLADGFVSGKNLTCPWHGWQFDVTSGACTFAQDMVLDRYQVTEDGDNLVITAAPPSA